MRRYREQYSEFLEAIKKERIRDSNRLTFWEKFLNDGHDLQTFDRKAAKLMAANLLGARH
ncbi:hypothetical protein OAB16_00890 [Planktomarina sp.]|nr:hypothetical protein [Planktomarina sp.]